MSNPPPPLPHGLIHPQKKKLDKETTIGNDGRKPLEGNLPGGSVQIPDPDPGWDPDFGSKNGSRATVIKVAV